MTPPDSGEREVRGECGAEMGPWYPYCTRGGGEFGAHGATPQIKIPLSLAQRILAALEKHSECGGCGLLAMDLRERLPR